MPKDNVGIQIQIDEGLLFAEGHDGQTSGTLECAWQGTGAALITHERARQKEVEGYEETDAQYTNGQLLDAACAYIALTNTVRAEHKPLQYWPWPQEFFRPDDTPIRALTKAGALIAAEIDRLLALEHGENEDGRPEESETSFPLLD